MKLRHYQQAAHDAAIEWIKKTTDPCVIDAATGAGKSHIIAAIAGTVHKMSGGKHILCIAPKGELVEQNHEKYVATGEPASMFSASTGSISTRYPVIFGTPGTIKNRIGRFTKQVCMVVVDEGHLITPTVKYIIEQLKELNDNLRVVSLSATPFRLGEGYIYKIDENDKPVENKDAYFTKCIYKIGPRELIDMGYLTPPIVGGINGDHYDTKHMELNKLGKFNQSDIDKAYEGQGRKTSRIIADVIDQSKYRNGVLIYAATIKHAHEIMESMPGELTALVTGATKKAERRKIFDKFRAKKLKYLVNVDVLTTGVDFTHVDVIAMLRTTESVSLLQQIIGRGLRIDECKENCLVLDYAENIDRHCPDGDIFNPQIKVSFKKEGGGIVNAECESCGTVNEFAARENKDGFMIDQQGYFLDLEGHRITTEHGPMPAHYGRRCEGLRLVGRNYERCEHRWTSKECPECLEPNDIAARYCCSCRAEIVNPNDKLISNFKAFKKDPTQLQTDEIIGWECRETLSQKGNECLRVDITTAYRSFSVWYQKDSKVQRFQHDYLFFKTKTNNGKDEPKTVTYKKESTGFYKIYDFNRDVDQLILDTH